MPELPSERRIEAALRQKLAAVQPLGRADIPVPAGAMAREALRGFQASIGPRGRIWPPPTR